MSDEMAKLLEDARRWLVTYEHDVRNGEWSLALRDLYHAQKNLNDLALNERLGPHAQP